MEDHTFVGNDVYIPAPNQTVGKKKLRLKTIINRFMISENHQRGNKIDNALCISRVILNVNLTLCWSLYLGGY